MTVKKNPNADSPGDFVGRGGVGIGGGRGWSGSTGGKSIVTGKKSSVSKKAKERLKGSAAESTMKTSRGKKSTLSGRQKDRMHEKSRKDFASEKAFQKWKQEKIAEHRKEMDALRKRSKTSKSSKDDKEKKDSGVKNTMKTEKKSESGNRYRGVVTAAHGIKHEKLFTSKKAAQEWVDRTRRHKFAGVFTGGSIHKVPSKK